MSWLQISFLPPVSSPHQELWTQPGSAQEQTHEQRGREALSGAQLLLPSQLVHMLWVLGYLLISSWVGQQ